MDVDVVYYPDKNVSRQATKFAKMEAISCVFASLRENRNLYIKDS